MGSHSSVPQGSHPWCGARLLRLVGPNKPRHFSRLSASGAGNTACDSVTAREHNYLIHVRKNVIFHLPWGNRVSDTNIFSKLFAFNYFYFVLIPTFRSLYSHLLLFRNIIFFFFREKHVHVIKL